MWRYLSCCHEQPVARCRARGQSRDAIKDRESTPAIVSEDRLKHQWRGQATELGISAFRQMHQRRLCARASNEAKKSRGHAACRAAHREKRRRNHLSDARGDRVASILNCDDQCRRILFLIPVKSVLGRYSAATIQPLLLRREFIGKPKRCSAAKTTADVGSVERPEETSIQKKPQKALEQIKF